MMIISFHCLRLTQLNNYGLKSRRYFAAKEWNKLANDEVPAVDLPILDSEIQACLEQNNPLAERQSHTLDIYLNIVLCLHKK